jgi:hypothetical protein
MELLRYTLAVQFTTRDRGFDSKSSPQYLAINVITTRFSPKVDRDIGLNRHLLGNAVQHTLRRSMLT